MTTLSEGIEELTKLVEQPRQYWLLGAGASFDANIPLMYPLTELVAEKLTEPSRSIFSSIRAELADDCHVEHVLSHIADLLAVADRSKSKSITLGGDELSSTQLSDAYKCVVEEIAKAVRYGYKGGAAPIVGTVDQPIIEIGPHLTFVDAIFSTTANRQARSSVSFFTTNYDTLIEDALALRKRRVVDGFSGGAVGFWDPALLEQDDGSLSTGAHRLLKLHGSVDWYYEKENGLVRARYGSKYLSDLKSMLIYPQATKYIETSKDPFSFLFRSFRTALMTKKGHVLCTVGYSFGDEHINQEIASSMSMFDNKSTLVVFIKEVANVDGTTQLAPALQAFLDDDNLKKRTWIASDQALYAQGERIESADGFGFDWWSMRGVSRFLSQGAA